jgi:hypothetical protein
MKRIQAVPIIFFLIICVSPLSVKAQKNAIDSLLTDSNVLHFIQRNFPEMVDQFTFAYFTTGNIDSLLKCRAWYKIDLNDDRRTDMLFINLNNRRGHNKCISAIISNEHGYTLTTLDPGISRATIYARTVFLKRKPAIVVYRMFNYNDEIKEYYDLNKDTTLFVNKDYYYIYKDTFVFRDSMFMLKQSLSKKAGFTYFQYRLSNQAVEGEAPDYFVEMSNSGDILYSTDKYGIYKGKMLASDLDTLNMLTSNFNKKDTTYDYTEIFATDQPSAYTFVRFADNKEIYVQDYGPQAPEEIQKIYRYIARLKDRIKWQRL